VTDRGSTSLAVVLTAPVMVVLMFVGFQAAMWNHARAQARAVARDTAVLVARDGVAPATAAAAARAAIGDASLLQRPAVDVQRSGDRVVVTITGRAPGVLRFTSAAVQVRTALPVEGWVRL
jgi:hypothetical protein